MKTDYINQYNRFLQDLGLARNYPRPYLLQSTGAAIAPNPILEQILPSLLYIRMVSLFDDGLILYINDNELSIPKTYKEDLNGRVSFLADRNLLKDACECHRIRHRRNSIAHEASANATWGEVDADLSIVEEELRNLGLVGQRPSYEFYAERSRAQDSEESGVLFEYHYCFGLKEKGEKRIEVRWTTKISSNK